MLILKQSHCLIESAPRSGTWLSRLTDWLGSDIYCDYMFTFNTQNIYQINSILALISKFGSGHNNTAQNRQDKAILISY